MPHLKHIVKSIFLVFIGCTYINHSQDKMVVILSNSIKNYKNDVRSWLSKQGSCKLYILSFKLRNFILDAQQLYSQKAQPYILSCSIIEP